MSFQSLSADGYIASYSIKVSDVQTFAKSFDELMTSNFGQEFPGTVTLGHFAFNGYDDASHAVVISYDSEADMAKGTQMFYTPTFGKFLNDVQSISEPIEQSLNRKLISGGNNNQADNSVYTTYYMSVKNPKKYAAAWKKLMMAQMDNIPGSFGLNAIPYGNRYSSHMVYLGADSMSELSEAFSNVIDSNDFKEFAKTTGDIRTLVNTELVQLVKTYDGS